MSLKDELQKRGQPSESFEMDGIETPTAVRALSPRQMLQLGKMDEDNERLMGLVAAWCLINPDTGEPYFGEDDAEFLMDHLTMQVLQRIGEAAKRLAGVATEEGKGG